MEVSAPPGIQSPPKKNHAEAYINYKLFGLLAQTCYQLALKATL